jgi:cyclic-di-GMP phosphodiesterase TipF (flagellum assembly factor)
MDAANQALEATTTAQSRKIVAELQILEKLMRGFAGASESIKAKPIVAAAPSLRQTESGGEFDLLETIRTSLEQNRVDLYLQPIVGLPQRKVHFYEGLSRLRAGDGSLIVPAQYIKLAAPAGLMPAVDNLLLFRCVQIVRRLTQKQRDIGIFCNISGDTLVDGGFFPQFLEFMHRNRDLAGHIVFEFSQEATLNAGAQGESNLAYLASLGFALSMDQIDSPDLDFVKLKKLGFRHIKLRASTLTDGSNRVQIAPEGLKKLLERHGLNLIAERVEDEHTVERLIAFGVDFAQGYLFGEPRAVRDESLKAMEQEPTAAPIIPFRKAG